jgi:hypothetical protein
LELLYFCQNHSSSARNSLVLAELTRFCQNCSDFARSKLILPESRWFYQNYSDSVRIVLVLPEVSRFWLFLLFCKKSIESQGVISSNEHGVEHEKIKLLGIQEMRARTGWKKRF